MTKALTSRTNRKFRKENSKILLSFVNYHLVASAYKEEVENVKVNDNRLITEGQMVGQLTRLITIVQPSAEVHLTK